MSERATQSVALNIVTVETFSLSSGPQVIAVNYRLGELRVINTPIIVHPPLVHPWVITFSRLITVDDLS